MVLEYLTLRINYFQKIICVWFETWCIQYRIKIFFVVLQVFHEISPVVAHVYQSWLTYLFHEEFMLWFFRSWIWKVPKVFIANVGMKQHVVQFNEKSQFILFALGQVWQHHILIHHFNMLKNSILSLRILTNLITLLSTICKWLCSEFFHIWLSVWSWLRVLAGLSQENFSNLLLFIKRLILHFDLFYQIFYFVLLLFWSRLLFILNFAWVNSFFLRFWFYLFLNVLYPRLKCLSLFIYRFQLLFRLFL